MFSSKFFKPLLFAAICMALFFVSRRCGWSDYLTDLGNVETYRQAVEENYLQAALVYVAATSICSVLLALPGVFYAVVGGLLFGPAAGTLLCLTAATMGAVLAFLAGRFFLRESVKPMLEKSPLLKKFLCDNADKNALILLMVTRLLPIFPYNLQNFAYGVTDIGIIPYTLYTFLFMAPGVAVFTVGTAGLAAVQNRREILYLAAGGLAVLAAVTVIVYKLFFVRDCKAA